MKDKILNGSDVIIQWLITHGLKILIIVVVAWILNIIISRIIKKAVRVAVVPDKYSSEAAEKQREDTLIRIFVGATRIVIITLVFMMILQEVGIKIGPIIAGAGIVGLAFGFGGQYLIRDIITGLFIILENQYRIGDVIHINDTSGMVEDISLRKTTLRDLDGTVHHIPHGEIKIVDNLSKDFSRINLNIRVSYNSNLEHVIKVINQVGNELAQDPVFKDSIISPPKFLRVDDFADSAIIIKILGDTKPLKQWEIAGEYRKRIKIAFEKERIEIPLPQRVVHQIKE